jgi:hypothetical protein
MNVIERYARDGYAPVPQLIAPSVANALLRQLAADMDARGAPLATQKNGSALLIREAIEVYGFHYPPMLTFLWGLTPFVSAAIGRDLLPAYSYFRIYQEGDICRVHSDRPSCEHSLSLTLDYSDGVPWDLEIGTDHIAAPKPIVEDDFGPAGFASVTMAPGDGVLYQGVNRRHGRVTPNPNAWSAHMFLHWVERDGPNAAFAFDGNLATARAINLAL